MQTELNLKMDDYLPLRDVVFNTLRSAILDGSLKPGERLMEVHLANTLGVSRTPIREAIHKLELEGLVVMVPRRGAQVAQISEKSLQDVLEVRRSLDVLIAELAAKRISDEDIIRLDEAREAFEKEVQRAEKSGKDTARLAKADVRFHDILIDATGNLRLKSLVNNLAEQMYRYRFVYLNDLSYRRHPVEEHKAIFDAVRSHDEKKAAAAAAIHIDKQKEAILSQIRMDMKTE